MVQTVDTENLREWVCMPCNVTYSDRTPRPVGQFRAPVVTSKNGWHGDDKMPDMRD